MPSFDIASSVDIQTLDNAVNIVKKEPAQNVMSSSGIDELTRNLLKYKQEINKIKGIEPKNINN